MFHICGRPSETAQIEIGNITTSVPHEFEGADVERDKWWSSIVNIGLWRTKTRLFQMPSIFVHARSLLLCQMFSMVYMLIMNRSVYVAQAVCAGKHYLFPEYAEDPSKEKSSKRTGGATGKQRTRAKKKKKKQGGTKTRGEGSKKAAGVFNDVLKQVYAETEKLNVEMDFTAGLSGHSFKKAGVNHAHDNPGCPILSVMYRAAWTIRNLHTICDYVINNMRNDRKIGRAQAGWTDKEDTKAGQPPSLNIFETDSVQYQLVLAFVSNLFGPLISFLPMVLVSLLAAVVLLRLGDFLDLLIAHPAKKFGSSRKEVLANRGKHQFVDAIVLAANHATGGSKDVEALSEMLLQWHFEVMRHFVIQNSMDLPWETVQKYTKGTADENIWQLDGRRLVTHLEETKKCNTVLIDQALKTEHHVASLSEAVQRQQQRNEKLEAENKLLREKAARQAETLRHREQTLNTVRELLQQGHAGKWNWFVDSCAGRRLN